MKIKLIMIMVTIMIIVYIYNCNKTINEVIKSINIKELKTGDILLFRHNNANSLLKYILSGKITHVGMVYENEETNKKYILEATGYGNVNEITHGLSEKVYIFPLKARMESYNGKVRVLKLNKILNKERKKKIKEIIKEKYIKMEFYDNKTGINEMIMNCGIKGGKFRKIEELENKYKTHCAKTIYNILIEIKLINKRMLSTCITPVDFMKKKTLESMYDGYKYKLYNLVI
jgi:hypothetical protein